MRVLAAMSGGVDSSVAAALLAEAGHEVVGVTLHLFDHAGPKRRGACCGGEDVADARRVADRLGIPHYVIDAADRFRAAVLDDFAGSYAAGETPVPCTRCNQHLKFGDLLDLAADLGAEAMATGHYVRRVEGDGGPELHVARDPARDQSWFLFATTASQLARSRFPLGDHPDKRAVRDTAARLGLGTAEKPDSQDLCFVGDGGYRAMVRRLRPDADASGEIVDERGQAVGRHDGVAGYTVGQARRLGPAAAGRVVTAIDAGTRRVTIGPRVGGTTTVRLREVNWLTAAEPRRATVKLRARDTLRPAHIRPEGDGALVTLDDPVHAAPGQACVFYDAGRVLGGGFIRG